MTKIINEYGDLVDDYQTALDFAKNWKESNKPCKECNDQK